MTGSRVALRYSDFGSSAEFVSVCQGLLRITGVVLTLWVYLWIVELETVYTNAHHCVQYRFSPVVIGGDHHDELFSGASHGSDVCYLLCLALWFVHCLS